MSKKIATQLLMIAVLSVALVCCASAQPMASSVVPGEMDARSLLHSATTLQQATPRDDSPLCIQLASFSVDAGTNALNLHEFNYYFGGQVASNGDVEGRALSNSERDQLLSSLASSHVAADLRAYGPAFIYALSSTSSLCFKTLITAQAQLILPKQFGEVLNGSLGQSSIALNDQEFQAMSYSSQSISYQQRLWSDETKETVQRVDFNVGLSIIQGIAFSRLVQGSSMQLNPYVPEGWDSTTNLAVAYDLRYIQSTAGVASGLRRDPLSTLFSSRNQGYGADFGIAYTEEQSRSAWSVSASLRSVGFINWSNVELTTAQGNDTLRSLTQLSNDMLQTRSSSQAGSNYITGLPTSLKVSGAYAWSDALGVQEGLLASFTYIQGLNSIGANTLRPFVSIDVETAQHGIRPACLLGLQAGGQLGFDARLACSWLIASTIELSAYTNSVSSFIAPSKAKGIACGSSFRIFI